MTSLGFAGVVSIESGNIVHWRGVGLLLEFLNVPIPVMVGIVVLPETFHVEFDNESAFWCCESPRLLPLSDPLWFLLSSFSLWFSFRSCFSDVPDLSPVL